MKRQRGILLLPVALTLAIVGTLAYTMTREGAMSVANVDAEYDVEVARYLAEAGVSLVKWQNEKRSCSSETGFGSVSLPGGTIETGTIDREGSNTLNISLTARAHAPAGRSAAVFTVSERKLTVYDRYEVKEVTLNGSGGNDTSITRGVTTSLATLDYVELTDDNSHALLKFSLPGALDYASVLSAQLSLTQYFSNSTQPRRALAVHRVTRDWGPGSTWASPWSTPGGDYVATATATLALDPGTDTREYMLRIDGLVQGWAGRTIDNQGLLLKPSGLLNARFRSLDASINKPKLVVRYHSRC